MYRTLGEVSVDEGTLDQLLIRIPHCEHVFTVETLDGHCGMNNFYHREGGDGQWLGLEKPPHGFQQPPVCPTCRIAITSPRYGRVFKRADLDILELNVASRMSRVLNKVGTSVNSFSKATAEASLKKHASAIDTTFVPTKAQLTLHKRRVTLSKKKRDTPIPMDSLDPGNKKLYDISSAVVAPWKTATKKLMDSYRLAAEIAATRSAHTNAWEAAFSCLYKQEMDRSVSDPAHAPRRPAEHAMRMARMTVGQPQPRADKKYVVEALWMTLTIRFTLIDLAQTWLKAANSTGTYPQEQLQGWGSFGLFLIEACIQDAQIAFETSKESDSRRQMTRSALFIMRAEFECFRYHVEMLQQSHTMKEKRNEMVNTASQKQNDAMLYTQQVLEDHREFRRTPEEETWLRDNFTTTAETILDEWQKMERTIRMDTFYEPVSLEEKMDVIKALGFCACRIQRRESLPGTNDNKITAYTGHFYNCPNGHLFVIGEVRF